MIEIKNRSCPLCAAHGKPYHQDKNRTYFQCPTCRLVFVPPELFVSAQKEKTIYELHQNSPDDMGYREFLSRLCLPMVDRLSDGAHGLDFGCGPGPTLSAMFVERGYPMALYDKFYATDKTVLKVSYDFITATEVVEHLQNPKHTLDVIWRCVNPGGYLGIMTKLVIDAAAFAGWHYKNDEFFMGSDIVVPGRLR